MMKLLRLAAVAVACTMLLNDATQAQVSFDGRWLVRAVADPGRCSDNYSLAIRVAGGRISYRGPFGAVGGGTVSQRGALSLAIDVVRAFGTLTANMGNGKWKSPNCSGTWTARKA